MSKVPGSGMAVVSGIIFIPLVILDAAASVLAIALVAALALGPVLLMGWAAKKLDETPAVEELAQPDNVIQLADFR